jgi:hypothetical protein
VRLHRRLVGISVIINDPEQGSFPCGLLVIITSNEVLYAPLNGLVGISVV